jgi:hypothetical protein
MVIVSRDVHRFKELVSSQYLMEDLGLLKHLIGMKIKCIGNAIWLSQDVYVNEILATYGMLDVRTAETLSVPNTRLVPATNQERADFLKMGINYRRAVGLLNHLAVSTCPEILFAMSQLSQHLEDPRSQHWEACVHLLRYLANTQTRGINLGNSISPVKIFTNTNHANDKINSYSYFGYLVMLATMGSYFTLQYLTISK